MSPDSGANSAAHKTGNPRWVEAYWAHPSSFRVALPDNPARTTEGRSCPVLNQKETLLAFSQRI
jgi:hypothetical protein